MLVKKFSLYYLIAFFLMCTLLTDKLRAQQHIPATVDVEVDSQFQNIRLDVIKKMKEGRCPSVAVGVAKEGEILWLEAFGWANKETGNPASPKKIYAIGSLSKSITATAALALITQGRLKLETRIVELIEGNESLQGLGGSPDEVRVEHLLNSTAGIPHGWISYEYKLGPPPDIHPWYRGFVCFPPGKVFEYSNNSFGVLQWTIESITKKTFEEALQELVFTPLGMTRSVSQFDANRSEEFAVPYDRNGSPVRRRHSTPEGGLGLYSTARDLLRYGMFHVGTPLMDQHPPLSDEWLNRMHTPGTGPGLGFFHLGWWSGGSGARVSNGSIEGANANLTIIPKEKLVVAVLTNQTSSLADELSGQIVASYVPASAEARRQTRTEYVSRFRTPYVAREGWPGTWKGTLLTPETEIPLRVTLKAEDVTIDIGDNEPVTVRNPTLNDFDELRGSLLGRIPGLSPEGDDQHQIRLMLRLGDGRLSGYMCAVFRTQNGGFSIPAYVNLEPEYR
jgi:CubicO group peptidase (beta-lactamase class C family)